MPPTALVASLSAAPVSPSPPPAPEPGSWPSLYRYLAAVPDPRAPRGRRHPLPALLAQVVCALLCGATHLQAISDWGRDHSPELLAQLGFTRATGPCGATLHYLLSRLDWTALENQLRQWVTAVEAQLVARDPLAHEEALALDGKTLRGSRRMQAEVFQLVTALGHRLGLTTGALEVPDGNEIAAVEALLKRVVVEGRVITVDALHTQRKTAALICARGGDYLMTVKDNQPELRAAIAACFAPHLARQQDRDQVCESATAHGRMEERRLVALNVETDLPGVLANWPEARQVFLVCRSTYERKRRRHRFEVGYGITSLTREEAGAADLLRLNRGHWQIEARHWVRDVTLREDASLVRTGKLPQVLALLRTVTLNRLRLEGVTNFARTMRRLAARPDDCLRLLGLAADF
jgi:predicted transposase YbfD/YdcC